MPDLSFGTLLILVECNYSGCTENLIAATATMAAAPMTATARHYSCPRSGRHSGGSPTSPLLS
ncbi:MAG TPA: hypothetical protein PLE00_07915 [Anaerolineaceae bacterium]|nr:hypothetical protein [Anaerolineaceae bacterium]